MSRFRSGQSSTGHDMPSLRGKSSAWNRRSKRPSQVMSLMEKTGTSGGAKWSTLLAPMDEALDEESEDVYSMEAGGGQELVSPSAAAAAAAAARRLSTPDSPLPVPDSPTGRFGPSDTELGKSKLSKPANVVERASMALSELSTHDDNDNSLAADDSGSDADADGAALRSPPPPPSAPADDVADADTATDAAPGASAASANTLPAPPPPGSVTTPAPGTPKAIPPPAPQPKPANANDGKTPLSAPPPPPPPPRGPQVPHVARPPATSAAAAAAAPSTVTTPATSAPVSVTSSVAGAATSDDEDAGSGKRHASPRGPATARHFAGKPSTNGAAHPHPHVFPHGHDGADAPTRTPVTLSSLTSLTSPPHTDASRFNSGRSVATRSSSRSYTHSSIMTGALEDTLVLGRSTASAAKTKGGPTFDSVLASFPKGQQFAIREMILDIMELDMRKDLIEERLELLPGEDHPLVLADILKELKDRKRRLLDVCGREDYDVLITVTNRVNREGLGLVAEAEEDAALTETESRVWRRKLDTKRKNRIKDASYISHLKSPPKGAAAAWDPPTSSATDEFSYYQRQQRKYGRGRRGSTSFVGAFTKLFELCGEDSTTPDLSAATSAPPPAVTDAVAAAKAGDTDALCTVAVEMAVQLKTLQKEMAGLSSQLREHRASSPSRVRM